MCIGRNGAWLSITFLYLACVGKTGKSCIAVQTVLDGVMEYLAGNPVTSTLDVYTHYAMYCAMCWSSSQLYCYSPCI